jgi:outer membrane protein assembly factor BamB
MKRLLLIFIAIVFASCSFDDKTGIWKDASNTPVDNQTSNQILENEPTIRYVEIFTKNKTYDEEKEPVNFLNIEISKPLRITNWPEQYAISNNNISNFFYSGNNILLSKSSKLSKLSSEGKHLNKKIIFYKNNLISYDHKGTIFIYSLNLNKKILKYNFYKKKFKNFNKEINFIVNEDTLYAADNLGYLYALNLKNNKIIWAKNYGIPFRSNLKFANNQIFLANQDNVISSIDSNTGIKNWQYATSITFLKSDFENTLALDLINKNIFFLNTSGELYSINYFKQNINWVLNFKNSYLSGDTELFLSQPIVSKNNNLIIATEKAVLSLDTLTGSRNWNLRAEPIFKPIITLNYTYLILKNNLLICLDNKSGDVVWSKNIFRNIKDKKIKNQFESYIDFKIVNGEINIYLKNGYLLTLSPKNGNLNSLNKISKKGISSEIFFLNGNMLFVDKNNKLLKFN